MQSAGRDRCVPVAKIAERLQIGWVGRVPTISDRDYMILLQRTAFIIRVLFMANSTSMALHVRHHLGESALCSSFHSVAAKRLPLLAQHVILLSALLLPTRQPLLVPFGFVAVSQPLARRHNIHPPAPRWRK